MNIKVVRRSQVIFHAIFLVFFSITLHYLVQVILSKDSLLNVEMFFSYLQGNFPLVLFAGFTVGALFLAKRISLYLMSALCLAVISIFIYEYYMTLNKGILITGFIYLICSYFIILSLYFEFASPPYSPGSVENQIDNRNIPTIEITGVDDSGREYKGELTKIALDSFYALDSYREKLRGNLTARVSFEGINFECLALEVTQGPNGRGFRVNTGESDSPVSWYNFYRILKDRGYYFE